MHRAAPALVAAAILDGPRALTDVGFLLDESLCPSDVRLAALILPPATDTGDLPPAPYGVTLSCDPDHLSAIKNLSLVFDLSGDRALPPMPGVTVLPPRISFWWLQKMTDAQAALLRLAKGKFHGLVGRIEEVHRYGKGRPKADGARTPKRISYKLVLEIKRPDELIEKVEREAGCFVLLTNVRCDGDGAIGSMGLLAAYKGQDAVERNFGFLKDDLIVNSLFLKSPARIEALGLALVLSLMIWRLMERTMRMSLKEKGTTITGWEKRQTSRPTSFMMTTRFLSVIVLRTTVGRFLGNPFDAVQLAYLKALGLTPEIFTKP
jgi:hypothetical protein